MPQTTEVDPSLRARQVLERVLLALLSGDEPVMVAFSGGRDSSALLALATDLARRRGLPPPVPLVQRWEHPSTHLDEQFQDHVLSTLGLRAEVIAMAPADIEVLGPWMKEALLAHGLTWPWRMHTRRSMLAAAKGCVLLDGEGGDEVFGPTRTRVLFHLRQARRAPLSALEQVTYDLGPRPLRRHLARQVPKEITWFTPAGVREIWWRSREELVERPLLASAAIRTFAGAPEVLAAHQAMRDHHTLQGVTSISPLLDRSFVDALAREAGALGWRDRSTAMRRVFGDVLDDRVLRRSDKVDFTELAWGAQTIGWLRKWERRSGVDTRWVDPEALAAHWASPRPHPSTVLMAQSAWLEQEVGRAPVVD